MGTGWRKARNALGLRSCISLQPNLDNLRSEGEQAVSESRGAGVTQSAASDPAQSIGLTPGSSRSSSGLNVIRTSIRLSRVTCAICLESMKPGSGHALFTAECSHTFHFSCIASNVRHGNLICPVCRAKWKVVPWQAPADLPSFNEFVNRGPGSARTRRHNRQTSSRSSITEEIGLDEEDQRRPDPVLSILDESIANARGIRRVGHEPTSFDDDEPLMPSTADAAGASFTGGDTDDLAGDQQIPDEDSAVAGDEGGIREDGTQRSEVSRRTEIDEQGMAGQNARKSEVRNHSPFAKGKGEEIVVTCYPEVSAVPASEERGTFTVLVHLKSSGGKQRHARDEGDKDSSENRSSVLTNNCHGDLNPAQVLDPNSRAPLDLVTVLDISGSMAGTKLTLLKQAMAFVIRNLSPADRLSVVVFSSSARRLFPLKRMAEDGRNYALRSVDALVCTGGTNIADGLGKGAKMLEDRRMKNPVASIMLLSDGQDTYTVGSRGQFSGLATPRHSSRSLDGRRLLPGSIRHRRHGEVFVPVHTFGFGADHDAATMHSISEASGGTFSFVQAEAAVQDAFAQCIGGLLSVISQNTTLSITAGGSGVQIKSIQAGSYQRSITENGSQGKVRLGDLYAEEERDILIELKLPAIPRSSFGDEENFPNAFTVLSVSCSLCDPVSTELLQTSTTNVQIFRPEVVDLTLQTISVEVDRQRNRVHIAQSILEAGHLADGGEISAAQQILARAKDSLHSSLAFLAGDQLSAGLESELTEIQSRVANRQIYERTGRAYILSAQSSHFRQRATTRGDLSDNNSHEYQTSSMADMVVRSQALPSRYVTPGQESRSHHSGRSGLSSTPSRMLVRRTSGRVQDSHGHRDSIPSP